MNFSVGPRCFGEESFFGFFMYEHARNMPSSLLISAITSVSHLPLVVRLCCIPQGAAPVCPISSHPLSPLIVSFNFPFLRISSIVSVAIKVAIHLSCAASAQTSVDIQDFPLTVKLCSIVVFFILMYSVI